MKGIATILCKECEEWARKHGCTEFASDCELANEESLRFHLSIGFEEENRIILKNIFWIIQNSKGRLQVDMSMQRFIRLMENRTLI